MGSDLHIDQKIYHIVLAQAGRYTINTPQHVDTSQMGSTLTGAVTQELDDCCVWNKCDWNNIADWFRH